jgi:hypothetical protein
LDASRIYPTSLQDSLVGILVADARFRPPTDSGERAWRKAVGDFVARLLKEGKIKS